MKLVVAIKGALIACPCIEFAPYWVSFANSAVVYGVEVLRHCRLSV